jgi:hypothetical protein
MKGAADKALAAAMLAGSLAMLAWGGRGFLRREHAAVDIYQEPLPRMCPPTLGDIAEEFGPGLAARKLGYLAVAGVGIFLASSSGLALVARRGEARRD